MSECQIKTLLENCQRNAELNKITLDHCLKLDTIKALGNAYTNVIFRYAMRNGSFAVRVNNLALPSQ